MKKLVFIFIIFFIPSLWIGDGAFVRAQVMVSYGARIYMANDTIFANGGISTYPDSSGVGGQFRNSGSVFLTGDWTNNSGNAAFTSTGGLNGGSTITCLFVGGNQNIQGNSTTEFYNLDLRGSGVKQLNSVDEIVRNDLSLNDRELATGTNIIHVTNTSPSAIHRSSGFVSSLDGGSLVRSTASTQSYLFPVGSSLNTLRYRPVEIAPLGSAPDDYAVRLANVDPTTEGYDVNVFKKTTISLVNPGFYHQIRRDAGPDNASITIYYDEALDGTFTGMGHWQNAPQWEDLIASPAVPQSGYNAMNAPSWDFSSPFPAFALVKILNECGQTFVPNAFSPDNDGENDMECVYGKCIKSMYFVIYDRWGEKVFETTNKSQCWDGTYKGKEMNTAVFVYYLKANLTTGEEVIKKGNISLMR